MLTIKASDLPKIFKKEIENFEKTANLTVKRAGFYASKVAQSEVKSQFTIRKQNISKSLDRTGAVFGVDNKTSGKSIVFNRDRYKFLKYHEDGGEHEKIEGRRFIIPQAIRELLGIPRNKLITRKYLAQNLFRSKKLRLQGARPFRKKINGRDGIWIKIDGRLRLLYLYKQKIKFKKRAFLENAVDKTRKRMPILFDRAYEELTGRKISNYIVDQKKN